MFYHAKQSTKCRFSTAFFVCIYVCVMELSTVKYVFFLMSNKKDNNMFLVRRARHVKNCNGNLEDDDDNDGCFEEIWKLRQRHDNNC
jgi:hypothetical protein